MDSVAPAILAIIDLADVNHPSPAVENGRLFLVGMNNIYYIGIYKIGTLKRPFRIGHQSV
jgi:hypothetical protein